MTPARINVNNGLKREKDTHGSNILDDDIFKVGVGWQGGFESIAFD